MDKISKRKNIRLRNYDYSQAGYYFITICTRNRENLFWNMECRGDLWSPELDSNFSVEKIPLSYAGIIVDLEIKKLNLIYENVKVNKYVIMPNHLHMIIILCSKDRRSKTAPIISRIVQQFKGVISKQLGFSLWQKSFYDHIIRNQQEYERIYEYIETNPIKWKEDEYYI